MPTVLRVGPYRFFFYAGDHDEPPHVHIEREDKLAKFWLSVKINSQSSGLTRFGCKGVVDFPGGKLDESRKW
jgi:hypothetical protein